MHQFSLVWLALIISSVLFIVIYGRQRKRSIQGEKLQSRPLYYSWYVALWCSVPALIILLIWSIADIHILKYLISPHVLTTIDSSERLLLIDMIPNVAQGLIPADPRIESAVAIFKNYSAINSAALFVVFFTAIISGLVWSMPRLKNTFNAQFKVEKFLEKTLLTCSIIAILTTIGIVLSVLFESLRFFQLVSPIEFLFSTVWSPQTAIRPDQVGSSAAFGAIPLFTGTLLIATIVIVVAVPIGLMSALYLTEFAHSKARMIIKPVLEILAGIPTVVYGFFAALVIAPFIRDLGQAVGLQVSSESALAAGLVMGIMIIPFISSLSDDVIYAVPQSLRDGSYALGATRSETITKVILPAALPGIIGSILLAISRAIGETMIVVMAVGFAANLTANPLDSVTTVTVQIVSLLKGDQEFVSAKTLAAFALGLTLFCVTLALNVLALNIVRKYREQYE